MRRRESNGGDDRRVAAAGPPPRTDNDVDFEYAIKMDVRNNPIVREIDQTRQRELWRSVLIGVGLVVVILFSLYQRFTVMRVGTDIERMQRQLQEEQVINRQLRNDVEKLSRPQRIAKLAGSRPLNMVMPDQASTLILERATVTPPPASSTVVAKR
jgi:cell division protein FtsL